MLVQFDKGGDSLFNQMRRDRVGFGFRRLTGLLQDEVLRHHAKGPRRSNAVVGRGGSTARVLDP